MIQVETQPITMTGAQYQAKYGSPPPIPQTPTLTVEPQEQMPITMTSAQYQAKYGQPPALLQKIGDATGINQASKDITSNDSRNPLEKGIAATSDVFGAVGQLPVLKQIGEVFGKGVNMAGDQLSKLYTPEFQKSLATMNPEDYTKATQPLKDLQNLGTIANTILMAKGAEKTAEVAPKVVDNVKNTVSDLNPLKTVEETNPRSIIGYQFRKTAEQYTRPGNLLSEAENQHGTNPIGVLESYGNSVIPKLDGGKITAQTIEEPVAVLEAGIEKLSNLKNDAVFLNDNTIKPSEYIKYIQDTAKSQASKGWSKMKINEAQTAINKFASKLNEAYPEDAPISVNDLDRFKTEQTGLSKSYKNLSAKPFELDAHGIIGSASKDLVEKFTDDAPTKEVNKLIQSHYDAIDLLESLRGKTPHGGRFTQTAEMLGGTVVGGLAGMGAGHPFLGAMFGRAGAHVVDSLLRSDFVTNPLKRMLIKDLGIKDPAVMKQMESYINENTPDIKDLGERLPAKKPTNK